MSRVALVSFFLLAAPALGVLQPSASQVLPARSSIEWLETASEQMNLREPGSASFHMKISFHAYPGSELLGIKEKPTILTGDGFYEETWVAPHQWRREVKFPGYHSLEVESDAGRKMQASSDYEPSRILMLLSAVLTPIPRNFASREFRHEGASGWRVHSVFLGKQELVRISKDYGSSSADVTDAFYLLPQGALLMRDERGLVTKWDDLAAFSGKLFAKKLLITAGTDRILLTADISVEPTSRPNPDLFNLPGGNAEPGYTMRPLLPFEVKMPSWNVLTFTSYTGGGTFSAHWVIDKHGRRREVELITAPDLSNATIILNLLRGDHLDTPKIDGSPCELQQVWSVT